ncbi:MAG: PLP-dependent lyase/thiolase [Acidobacteria bacterium]|nr:PLP-dependent lyase/thiolase [Acidobacteriota bacterium]
MAPPAEQHPFPFRCAHVTEGDDIDHVVRRLLARAAGEPGRAADPNPFVEHRALFHSYHVARTHGMSDEAYVEIVRRLDDAVAAVDGHGFRATPFRRCDRLSERLGFRSGGIWVKDETGNVSGSHKARHLMGVMLYLEVIDRLGLVPRPSLQPTPPPGLAEAPRAKATGSQPLTTGHWQPGTGFWPLAIASCGNAALAAAVVARAASWPLDVYVPPSANPAVLARLQRLGAHVHSCGRRPGVTGDPCYHAFHDALASGALPFCVQGSDNGLTIEGGETLAWEMVGGLGKTRLDRLIVQVGGGALASACIQGFSEAAALGRIEYAPRVFTVQTAGAYPLKRAYDRLVERVLARLREEGVTGSPQPDHERSIAMLIRDHFGLRAAREELIEARQHRSRFMWPWEREPQSIAHGILDDETYDWAAVVEGMLSTGGSPVVVDDRALVDANALARDLTGVNVDHTGSAGLAGLMQLLTGPDRPSPDEQVAVIFSGVQR